jgi:N-ethylmaleimide reductase
MPINAVDPTGPENQPLLQPVSVGGLTLRNRIVMAAMTRARADNAALTPTPLHREYYRQRAGAGLIVSEGTWVSPDAIGSANVPGIFSDEQVRAWVQVTEAVHAAGGRMFVQIAHSGAYAHPDYRGGRRPAGPSAVNVGGRVHIRGGSADTPTPRPMTRAEIDTVIADFRAAAVNARRAGFDGVELHAHRWYLLAEFLSPRLNLRTDEYGGSIADRARLLFAVLDAVVDGFGSDRVGVKLAPYLSALDGSDVTQRMWPTYEYVMRGLSDRRLAYLHVMGTQRLHALQSIRDLYPGTLIANGGFDQPTGNAAIDDGQADLISYGQPFIANPDLPARFTRHLGLADADPATIYTGGAKGYVDYPPAELPHHAAVLGGVS